MSSFRQIIGTNELEHISRAFLIKNLYLKDYRHFQIPTTIDQKNSSYYTDKIKIQFSSLQNTKCYFI